MEMAADKSGHKDLPPYEAPGYLTPDKPPSGEEPPPYTSASTGTGTSAPAPRRSSDVPPETLVLTRDYIQSATTPSSPRLYELSHHILQLHTSNTAVQLSRIDYPGRTTTSAPTVPGRKRQIFTLTRPPSITWPTFEFYLESHVGTNLGDLGLEPYKRFRSAGYRIWKTTPPRSRAEMRPTELVFTARSRGGGRYDWRERDEDGKVLAYETFGAGYWQLQVVEEMGVGWRDALVGAWCLRLWHEVVDTEPRPSTCK